MTSPPLIGIFSKRCNNIPIAQCWCHGRAIDPEDGKEKVATNTAAAATTTRIATVLRSILLYRIR